MCGILITLNAQVSEASFRSGLAILGHRGPDSADIRLLRHERFNAWLGHRRLAIIDLSEDGRQPMFSPDGRYAIVFNGEIYNYRELRRELEVHGVRFQTQSDTEVLLWALIIWGQDALPRLDGMFAFAFADTQEAKLLVARDALGVKPLYYARHAGGWVFASEVKAMFPLGLRPRLRRELLGEYLANLWVMEPDTLFAGVYKLPAGAWMSIQQDQTSQGRFWDPPQTVQPYRDTEEALEALLPRLERAVASQMVADVPVGAYVSGGVDSSIVAVLAQKHVHQGLITVGARFSRSDKGYEAIPDDGEFIDLLVSHNPTFRHTDLRLEPDLFEEYVRLVRFMDEPIADPAVVPAYLLAQEARRQGAIVMLSGMGGDELFGGYARYAALPLLEQLHRLPRGLRSLLLKSAVLGQRLPHGVARKRARDAERFVRSAQDPWPLAYNNLSGHYGLGEIDVLVGAGWREAYGAKLEGVLAGWETEPLLRQAQLIDLKGFLASHNTIYSDKASMAASVEVRVPLMNVDLAEFALTLPDVYKLKGGENKPLLKLACARIAGSAFAYRKKAGFAMPIRSWLRGPLSDAARTLVLSERMTALLPRAPLEHLVEEHRSGRRENTWKLWALLTLALWLEAFSVETEAELVAS